MKVALPCAVLALALGSTSVLAGAPVPSDLAQRWQGVWIIRDADYPGSVQAWAVQGNSVDVYDPRSGQDRRERFTLVSPCRLVRTQSDGSGGAETVSTNTFAFAPDGLHVAPAQSAGGLKRGNLITACIGDNVYTFDTQSGQCQKWNATMSGSPTSAEGCALDPSPPAFVLQHFQGGEDLRLNLSGDALLSPGLAAQVAAPQRGFQAAIRMVTQLSQPH